MPHEDYEAVIGLEVHCQLLTASKAFSPEPAAFGAAPNTNVDPVSLGHPGTLPVLNERLVDYTLRMGLATHSRIAPRSVFARKHYFYPDLPKGYQISQYETPICEGGYVEVEGEGDGGVQVRRIRLRRIHMEEDAGKSLHDQDPYATYIDHNRCGVPLIEIVSEPDIRTPREAALYVQKIRQIVRYLGICDGNMEEGSLRCDANVSVRRKGETRLGTKTEVKNMNSFRSVERALEYEIRRQIRLLEAGGTVVQETRLWDADRQETRPMRSKEEAHDYRYFPDPDLVPVVVTEERLAKVRAALPEMPEARRRRYVETWCLPAYDAAVLTEERGVAEYFEATVAALAAGATDEEAAVAAKAASNFVMTDVLRVLNERGLAVEAFPIAPARLAALIRLRLEDRISSSAATELFERMLEDESDPEALARAHNLLQVSDAGALLPVVEAVLERHPKQLQQYLGGKEGVLGFFIGQVMRTFPGAPDPRRVRELLLERIAARRERA
ncbi:Asp-tRNA(Asn)/Glu-tRNA(Gln) amidotransferase subunit GatB [Rhodocaloribacter litoris]|uniref:Asp-tRNA(Asn)/Glu-tRNA(Gln) amidotransferase subunit GatB n=1 Tax=Rhodocaloribacter litoris TaxID=2558931 RepID=UPI00141ECDE0|nr:Asp-tRNA(Asn)/Glu-tRNA(Gln) amidotransferase subunit GatB [Rhodocaloribacter litoris]QXD15285.1 Asp-tRNA(Asn)/Glu-tRNA(Gln) amidotransferase subunit GatB [Rhodocaloribacter litoris]